MATITTYFTTISSATGTGTWTNTANALYSPSLFATYTSAVVGTGSIVLGTANIANLLPSNAIVDQVRATIAHYVSNTGRWTAPTLTLGAPDPVTTSTLTLSTTTTFTQSFTYTNLSTATLRDAAFEARYSIPKSGTQNATANVDYIRLDIDYRSETWQEIKL